MSDSAKFTVTDGTGSWVELDGSPVLAESGICYVGFQVYVPSATEAAWLGGAFNDSPLLLWLQRSGGALVDWVALHDNNADDVYENWETNFEGTFAGAAIAGGWHLVEWLREPTNGPGPYSLTIDGTQLFSDTFGPSNDITKALFGAAQQHGAAPASGDVYIARIRIGTTDGGTEVLDWDASTVSDFSDFSSTTGTVVLASAPSSPPAWAGGGGGGGGGSGTFADDDTAEGGAGGVRIAVAFNDTTFEPDPEWTFLTALASVRAAAYKIDKGKQDEQDQVGATQALINVFDKDGTLDPTNSSSPYYGLIDALLQVRIELWNPVAETWHTRFRGFIRDLNYVPYPGSHVDPGGVVRGFHALEIDAVGIMEPLTAIELAEGAFGDTPPAGTEGNVFFDNATFQDRITQVWGNAGIPDDWLVAFTGNVEMAESRYSAGSDNVMSVIQDAVDAELPTVANAYEDRFGRLAVHGRLAELDPAGTAASTTPDRWDFHEWKVGDETAVNASPSDTAHIRPPFAFNRGLGHIVNSAYCTPAGIAQADKAGQYSTDPTSIGKYGIRSWSKENLYISAGLLTGNTKEEETKAYADFIVANQKDAKNRITQLTLKTMRPDATGAAANWAMLCKSDVQDSVEVTITFTGRPADSPNFNLEPFFILGIHEEVRPLNPDYALVSLSLDVAPRPLDDVGLATPG